MKYWKILQDAEKYEILGQILVLQLSCSGILDKIDFLSMYTFPTVGELLARLY